VGVHAPLPSSYGGTALGYRHPAQTHLPAQVLYSPVGRGFHKSPQMLVAVMIQARAAPQIGGAALACIITCLYHSSPVIKKGGQCMSSTAPMVAPPLDTGLQTQTHLPAQALYSPVGRGLHRSPQMLVAVMIQASSPDTLTSTGAV